MICLPKVVFIELNTVYSISVCQEMKILDMSNNGVVMEPDFKKSCHVLFKKLVVLFDFFI